MNDELECFRKAAEFGCEDLDLNNVGALCICLIRDDDDPRDEIGWYLPHQSKRINRYAAAVCEIFFRERAKPLACRVIQEGACRKEVDLCVRMAMQARAFGKKYGGDGK